MGRLVCGLILCIMTDHRASVSAIKQPDPDLDCLGPGDACYNLTDTPNPYKCGNTTPSHPPCYHREQTNAKFNSYLNAGEALRWEEFSDTTSRLEECE